MHKRAQAAVTRAPTHAGAPAAGALCIFAWSASITGSLFLLLRWVGWLRASKEDEQQGLDYVQGIGTGVVGCGLIQRR